MKVLKVNIVINPSQNSYIGEFSTIWISVSKHVQILLLFLFPTEIYMFISNSCWKVLAPNDSLQLESKPWPWSISPSIHLRRYYDFNLENFYGWLCHSYKHMDLLKLWKNALSLNSFLFHQTHKEQEGIENGRGVNCMCSEVKIWNQCYQDNFWSDIPFVFSQI